MTRSSIAARVSRPTTATARRPRAKGCSVDEAAALTLASASSKSSSLRRALHSDAVTSLERETASSAAPAGTVFDRISSRCLLAQAVREGLVGKGPTDDDMMTEALARDYAPGWLLRQISQQLILDPHVITSEYSCSFLVGDMLSDGTVKYVSRDEGDARSHEETLETFSVEPLLGLMDAAGRPTSVSRMKEVIAEAEREDQRLRPALSAFGIERDNIFDAPMSIYLSLSIDRRPGAHQLRADVKRANELLEPLLSAFSALQATLGLAESTSAPHVFLPRAHHDPADLGEVLRNPNGPRSNSGLDALMVLRVTTTRLGALPFRPTLSDTLAAAQSAAAEDLRGHVLEWTDVLGDDSEGALRRIENKVQRAAAGLRGAGALSEGGRLVTYLGGAQLVMAPLLSIPPSLGIATTVMGAGLQCLSDGVRRRYRWASFGSE